ncbi:hypothetical protein [Escherichia coli]|nr:hypothetical protein [Escherichia coli]EHM3041909.1 hypothetical protein [Escherichia coli]EHZ3665044.1 hypothetical protein [Escherichia coli]EIA0285078.1 hypothetical protein [Escherichia coli]EID0496881.1 hypothetical protein [Escherichia coli]EIF5178508.1 hypothetical protein [Escherichia coli]
MKINDKILHYRGLN